MLVNEHPHFLPGARDIQRVVLVAVFDLRQQIPKSLHRNLVWICSGIRQDDVHTLQELFEVDLKVRPLLQIQHCFDGLFQNVIRLLRISNLLFDPRFNVRNALIFKQLNQSPIP